MFDKIRLQPEGIKKVNKKLVVVTAAGLLLLTVLLFGLESERSRTTSSAPQAKKEAPSVPVERVSVESFNRLPQDYAFIQGVATKNEAQQKQQPQTAAKSSPDPSAPPVRATTNGPYQTTEEDVRKKLDDEARTGSKIFFSEAGQGIGASSPREQVAQHAAPPYTRDAELQRAFASLPGVGGQQDASGQREKRSFYNEETSKKDLSTYVKHTVQDPVSPYQITAGTILPAVLITGINSDLPGQIIAQIRENVYDTATGRYLLVPQGTKVIGTYDNMISWAQERVMQVWSRLVFPNGSSIILEGMPGSDLAGQSGLADSVNNHYGKLASAVLLSAFLSAGAVSYGGNVDGYYPTVQQQIAASVGADINRAGQKIVERQLNVAPTIQVRPGFKFTVMVNRDLVLRPYQ